MVLLTFQIYKAILQTFNSQPPPVRFDSLVAVVLEDSSEQSPPRGGTLLPFQFLSESVISSVYDSGKNSNGNA